MKKWHIILSIIVIYFLLLLFTLYKSKETSEVKELQKQERATAVQPVSDPDPEPQKSAPVQSKQTKLSDLQTFEGCLDSNVLTRQDALKYLEILLKGDHDSISYYEAYVSYQQNKYKNSTKPSYTMEPDMEDLYQKDICITVNLLSAMKETKAYGLILKIIERKTAYPKALICAAGALMSYGEFKDGIWHVDERGIPVLRKILYDKNPDVRLQAAGTLLSLGESDPALSVLKEMVGPDSERSKAVLDMLFALEEKENMGIMTLVPSDTRLWDERGKEILLQALDSLNIEVRAYSAFKLVHMGIDIQRAEDISLDILDQLKYRKVKDYEDMSRRLSDRNAAIYAMDALKKTGSATAENILKTLIENSDDPYLIEKAKKLIE